MPLYMMWLYVAGTLFSTAHGCASGPGSSGSSLDDLLSLRNSISGQTAFPSSSSTTPVVRGSDVSCNFDSSCVWAESPNSQLHWDVIDLRPDLNVDAWRRVTGRSDLPTGKFAGVANTQARNGEDAAILEALLPCLQNDATIRFRHWMSSSNTVLRACIFRASSSTPQCSNPITRTSPSAAEATFQGPINEPFRIQIKANGFIEPSFIAVDDVTFEGDVCTTQGSRTTQGPSAGGGCDLNCNFDSGTACSYQVRGAGSVKGQWNVQSGRIGNINQGVKPNPTGTESYYAYVGSDAKTQDVNSVYVLESPTFMAPSGATLNFDMFQRNAKTVLNVCIDTINNCPYKNPQLNANTEWYTGQVVNVPAGSHKIMFVAKSVSPFAWLAVDNVRITGDYTCSGGVG